MEDLGPELEPDGVVDRIAEDGRHREQHHHQPDVERRAAERGEAPTAKSSESPGRNGVTTSPVSQKTTTKRIR